MKADASLNNLFNKAMADLSGIHMKKILEKYEGFEGVSLLVDVAGGTGASLNMVISKYPSIKGINFDLPHVIQSAQSYPGKILNFFIVGLIYLIILTCNFMHIYEYT